MADVRLRKVLRDFGAYRARSAVVVASIAVGVFAVGTIAGANALLEESLAAAARLGNTASATFYTAAGFDGTLVDAIARMPGVQSAEGRRSVSAYLEPASGASAGEGSREIQVIALPDFARQPIDRILPQSGRFPPRRGELVFERSALSLVALEPGQAVVVRAAGGRPRTLRVAGLAYEPGASPAYYFGRLTAYATIDTLRDLGFPDTMNELRIRADDALPGSAVQRLADDVRQRLERAGAAVSTAVVPGPGRHPAASLVQAVFLVLGAIGFLSLLVAAFLIVNTVSLLMAQHTRQIGIMKAVGASGRQVATVYLTLVALYAGVALVIAVPLAALASVGLANVVAGLLNVDLIGWLVPPDVVAFEVAAGLAVPLLAALVPIRHGARITVHAALADTGADERFGLTLVDRWSARIRGVSRPTLLSIRSTFRRKARLALTLAALTLAGGVFMTIFTVRGALYGTLDDTVRYFDYDVQVQLSTPERADVVRAAVLQVPGTVTAEAWRFASAQRVRLGGADGASLVVFGLPAATQTVQPIVQSGRWLLPGEGNALVVTANLLRDEPDLRVGDPVTLKIAGQETRWTLVGIVQSPTFAPFLYVDEANLGRLLGGMDRTSQVMVKTVAHDGAAQAAAARAVRGQLEAAGIGVSSATTSDAIMTTLYGVFDALVVVVTMMALLLGLVGGLGLAGTMTMNVVERSREIGIMRAIGAGDLAVRRIFVTEGVVIGLLAWLAGAAVSLPVSRLLSDALGEAFVQHPLAFSPSLAGLLAWLGVVIALSAGASLWPAWGASRMVVRQVLMYE